jgi:hypothetical protein
MSTLAWTRKAVSGGEAEEICQHRENDVCSYRRCLTELMEGAMVIVTINVGLFNNSLWSSAIRIQVHPEDIPPLLMSKN